MSSLLSQLSATSAKERESQRMLHLYLAQLAAQQTTINEEAEMVHGEWSVLIDTNKQTNKQANKQTNNTHTIHMTQAW
jgi:hypothetical protein